MTKDYLIFSTVSTKILGEFFIKIYLLRDIKRFRNLIDIFLKTVDFFKKIESFLPKFSGINA